MPPSNRDVHRYHDATKHHVNRFARSLGYLDWASQPAPFRAFPGARVISLYPAPAVAPPASALPDLTYDALFGPRAAPAPIHAVSIGDLLRHALGLSAWKEIGTARWSLQIGRAHV